MSALFQKLNLKDQSEILVINPPEGFEAQIQMLKNVTVKGAGAEVKSITFALAFVTRQKEVDALAKAFAKKAQGDAVIWFAYPKGSSKKYTCEFNRDTGWALLGEFGFEPVRQVAVDDDWSALRFRRVEFIKTLTRSFAISKQGKARTNQTSAKRKKA